MMLTFKNPLQHTLPKNLTIGLRNIFPSKIIHALIIRANAKMRFGQNVLASLNFLVPLRLPICSRPDLDASGIWGIFPNSLFCSFPISLQIQNILVAHYNQTVPYISNFSNAAHTESHQGDSIYCNWQEGKPEH